VFLVYKGHTPDLGKLCTKEHSVFLPPYSLDLAPSNFHLFTHLKQFLGGTGMGSNEDVKKTVRDRFNRLAADFYDAGIHRLVT
jgi:histone-lysine N-methyltransferase SETMAR